MTLSVDVDTLVLIDAEGSRTSTPGLYPVTLSRGSDRASDIAASVQLTGEPRVLERLPAGL